MFAFIKLTVLWCALSAFMQQPHYAAEACSSRTVPKPRPSTSSSSSITATITPTAAPTTTSTTTPTTTTTARPNITFPTYKCPSNYDAWYCLNEASCFSVKIGESVMYNCECALGFMGPRCEYKELDGSYLPKRPRPMLEKASIASGATCALLFMLFLSLALYLRYDQRPKALDDDEELDAYQSYCEEKCRRCCCCCAAAVAAGGDVDDRADLLCGTVAGGKYQQRTDAFMPVFDMLLPAMSFAFKRSTKL